MYWTNLERVTPKLKDMWDSKSTTSMHDKTCNNRQFKHNKKKDLRYLHLMRWTTKLKPLEVITITIDKPSTCKTSTQNN